ncbi:metal ABC transporter solute-binding protein, Zn/Mn family [Marinicrinis sediminis]|uniref:Metal ABC transporter solute-binding protein, Zn/Mn family n=1 Tax=Marinicrinis sediminis TaxID=1652465 RepID=A0ABW5R9A3_9BACL
MNQMQLKLKSSPFKRWALAMGYILVVAVFLAGCGAADNSAKAEGEDKLKITATIGMIKDVVANIGGEHVEVTGLMGEGVDPHLFKATQGDVKKLDQADLIFYNGLHLESKLTDILDNMSKDKTTVAVAEFVDESKLLDGDPSAGTQHDPHVWFDLEHWITVTEVIRDTLVEEDAEHADAYKENAEAYLAKLQELHTYTKEQIATIPKERRVLVTAHDAFGYFGQAYDIEVTGLQGISTASEAGVKDVTDLVDYLVENEIKAVFVESSISDKSINAVIEGAKAKGHDIQMGGELFSDAMGSEGTEEGTYLGMVRHNVDTIVSALK